MVDVKLTARPFDDNVTWYEFLLNDEKLLSHLSSDRPDPTPWSLIQQFFDQVNKITIDQGQPQQPVHNLRNTKLNILALQTAALCKWNIYKFEKELSTVTLDYLIKELMKTCKVPQFPLQDIVKYMEQSHDHMIISVVIYCLWILRICMKDRFPVKPGGRTTPVPVPGLLQGSVQQRELEMKAKIINAAKEMHTYAVQVLEVFLQKAKRHLWIPNRETLLNQNECGMGDPKGDMIPCEEIHAQVCFELGCFYFASNSYHKSYEMFGFVKEWLKQLPAESYGFYKIDNDKLHGYLTATSMCSGKTLEEEESDESSSKSFHMVNKYSNNLSEGRNSSDLLDLLMEDIIENTLPLSFRKNLEKNVMEQSQGRLLSDTAFDVMWLNAVCCAVRGHPIPINLLTFDMNIAQLQRIIGIVQQIYNYVPKEAQTRLGEFFIVICNNILKPELQKQLLNCEVTQKCLSPEKIIELKNRKIFSKAKTSISPKPVKADKNNYAIENVLINSLNPKIISETIKKMHKQTASGQLWKLYGRWIVPPAYTEVIKDIKDPSVMDLIYILMAKLNHTVRDEDYNSAKDILSYIQEINEKGLGKIKKIANNESLRIELLELLNDTSLKFSTSSECKELREQLSDVLWRVQNYLEKPQEGVPPSHDLGELCIALLLNLEHRKYISDLHHANDKHARGSHKVKVSTYEPTAKLTKILLNVNEHVQNDKMENESFSDETKKYAARLWDVVSVIFVATVTKSQDGSRFIRVSDLPQPLLHRPDFNGFVKKIRNPNILQLILSLLVRLLRLCEGDVLIDIIVPFSNLWPNKLDGKHKEINTACLSHALMDIFSHSITCQPHNIHWIRTQGDLQLAYSNHIGAIRSYLTIGAVASNFFNQEHVPSVYNDDVLIKNMIKCCKELKCFTQAAVFCQMLKEIDYLTAIKALQESKLRSDAMELHYLDHIWDVQLLEHAAYIHRETGDTAKKMATLKALANPEINSCNTPHVLSKVEHAKKLSFFRALTKQHLTY